MQARAAIRASRQLMKASTLRSNGTASGFRNTKNTATRSIFSSSLFSSNNTVFLERKKEEKGGKKGNDKKGGAPGKGADDWDKTEVTVPMTKIVEDTKTKISALRVGRAEPGYLAGITVENKPLAKVAQIQVRDPTTLTVALFDPAMVPKVEKELRESDLNLNPSVEGRVIIVPVPRPTNEFKKRLVKKLGTDMEAAKVDVRKARQKAMTDLKSKFKLSEDEQRQIEKNIQKIHDETVKTLDTMAKKKEEEIMK